MVNSRNLVFNGRSSVRCALAGVVATAGLFLYGCGSEKKEASTTPATPAVQYADVKTLVATNCATASCHAAGKTSPDLSTETGLNSSKTKTLDRIARLPTAAGAMPQGFSGSTAWNTTTDGAKLKTYLESVK